MLTRKSSVLETISLINAHEEHKTTEIRLQQHACLFYVVDFGKIFCSFFVNQTQELHVYQEFDFVCIILY